MSSRKVIIKSKDQIAAIRESGKYLTELLHLLFGETKVGVSLLDLEKFAQKYLDDRGLKGAFKGYDGYPANLCLSVNDCVVHGIPDDYVLKTGDLLKIDCGVLYKGGISDAAISIVLGGELANPEAYKLMKATKEALDLGLEKVKPNAPLFGFSKAVHDHVAIEHGYSVLENLTGHGVGQYVHEAPHIYNIPHPVMKKQFFKQNMVVALEPITSMISRDIVEKPGNHRNLYTQKGDLGAQWEYTIAITQDGHEVLAGIQEFLQ